MKLMILHLSDIHFPKDNGFSDTNVVEIVRSLQSEMRKITNLVIIISGDIAYSGITKEYDIAREFLTKLREEIKAHSTLDSIEILMVPGNHDVNYNIGNLTGEGLKKLEEENAYDTSISDELTKISPFLKFAQKYKCFEKKRELIDVKEFSYGNKSIKFNLINTAIFSSLDEDQGYHYLPMPEIEKLKGCGNYDFVFSIMHHPHHWYSYRVKKELEAALYEKSDLLYVGHEHYTSSMRIESNNSSVAVFAGGMLCNRGDWQHSHFYVGILDLETRDYTTTTYKWNEEGKIYCPSENVTRKLAKNRSTSLGIAPKVDYVKSLLRDVTNGIVDDFTDYYVFPLLEMQITDEKEKMREIDTFDALNSEIESVRKICFVGNNDSGKTCLAKYLFKKFKQTKVVLFLSAEDIGKGNPEKMIRNVFEETYSDDPIVYQKFKTLSKDEKMLIIDDADLVDNSRIGAFLDYVEENFGYVVQTSRNEIEFDVSERFRKRNLEKDYSVYGLCSFYSDRRHELVSKLVDILVKQDDASKDKIVTLLCEALTKKKGLFNWKPEFIVQFVKYYCNNVGEASIQNDGDVYSKVFEANITSLIKPHLSKMSTDKAFIILDKIAYQMHIDKMDPISLQKMGEVIEVYNEEFDANVDSYSFIQMLQDAGIIKRVDGKFKFTQRNYLAYFVAREIKRKCLEEGDYSEFQKALDYACFGINADIVLFVTYITDNLNIINMIMEKTETYVDKWELFSADPIAVQYLVDINPLKIPEVTPEEKESRGEYQVAKKEAKQERISEKADAAISQRSVYDYDEDDLGLVDELVRSMSLMMIVSRLLPNFEHMMRKREKEKCVTLIYTLPLRIFNVWATQLEENKIQLIEELKEIDETTYRKEKIFKSDDDVLRFLRWESGSLLLDLMNNSMKNAARDNTYGFLDKFEYQPSTLFRIAHLMELARKDSVEQFDKEVCSLNEDTKQGFIKTLIKRVTRNYIISSKRISTRSIQRLNNKIFSDRLNKPVVLLQKNAQRKKE